MNNRTTRAKGVKTVKRTEIMRTISLPVKLDESLMKLMDGRSCNNVSEYIRTLIAEEKQRANSRAVVFNALDIAAKDGLTPAIVTRIIKAFNRD